MKFAILIASLSFVLGASLVTLAMVLGHGGLAKSPTVKSSPTSADSGATPRDRNETTTYRAITPTDSTAMRVEVELTGYRDRWQVRYPGPTDRFDPVSAAPATGSEPDGAVVHVPADSDVRLTLKSLDFVYMLSLPRINKSQVAVPGLEFHLEFHSLSPGVFFLHGDHLCGPTDPRLTVTVRVGAKSEFPTGH